MQLYLRHFVCLWTWPDRWQAECGQISILNQWMTDTTSCIFHTRIDMNNWFFLSWIQTIIFHFSWRTLQVVFFIPTLIWIIDVSFMNHNEGTFLQVLCKWQHIYCQYPRACHPLKAIEPTSLYWDILTAYLKMPGDHAVIFRKDVPIQGFTALWAHTWSGPGVRTCLLWVCYLHLTKLEFDTEEPILFGSELGNSNSRTLIFGMDRLQP